MDGGEGGSRSRKIEKFCVKKGRRVEKRVKGRTKQVNTEVI